MNVSFKGIKNPTYFCFVSPTTKDEVKKTEKPIVAHINYHVELTNKNGNDLDTFKRLLEKYPNPDEKNSINITATRIIDPLKRTNRSIFSINGEFIKMNEACLHTFIDIQKLMKRIDSIPTFLFELEPDYLSAHKKAMNIKDFHTEFFKTRNTKSGIRSLLPEEIFDINKTGNHYDIEKTAANLLNTIFSERLQSFFEKN